MQKQIHLRVYGVIWSGHRSVYQYSVAEAPKDEREALRVAGDFQSLIDWHVLEEKNEYEHVSPGLSRRIDTFRTLRGWRNGFSDRRFNRIANA